MNNIAFHQNTHQQPSPQPQAIEESANAEHGQTLVDSIQSSIGLDISPLFLVGAFVVALVFIGLLVKFSKPKQEKADETSANDASSNSQSDQQTTPKDDSASTKPPKSKKKQTRRQRKNQK